jgi:hypothetical protein
LKYTLAIPIQQQDTVTVAKAVVEAVAVKFGIPQLVLTDIRTAVRIKGLDFNFF